MLDCVIRSFIFSFGQGKWSPESRSTYNLFDPVIRSTVQITVLFLISFFPWLRKEKVFFVTVYNIFLTWQWCGPYKHWTHHHVRIMFYTTSIEREIIRYLSIPNGVLPPSVPPSLIEVWAPVRGERTTPSGPKFFF